MLTDKKDEQMTLFREMLIRKMTVREAENLARKVAQDKVRKKQYVKDPNILEIETDLAEKLGTRVHIEKRDVGGVIAIDFFSVEDLENIVEQIKAAQRSAAGGMSEKLKNAAIAMGVSQSIVPETAETTPAVENTVAANFEKAMEEIANPEMVLEEGEETTENSKLLDDRGTAEVKSDDNAEDDELYNIKNFII
jgi:hypothetical protein